PHNYADVLAGKAGTLFLLEAPLAPALDGPGGPRLTIHKFELDKRKIDKFLDGIASAALAHNGEKLLYKQEEPWFIVSTNQPPKPGEGALKLDGMEVRVDPRAEWRQMYHEAWRIERDFLYDPGFHGLDLKSAEQKYDPYLERLAGRRDLNYLFAE